MTCDICPALNSACNNGKCWERSLIHGTMLHNVNGIVGVGWDEAKVMCLDCEHEFVLQQDF